MTRMKAPMNGDIAMSLSIRLVSHTELERLTPSLVELLRDTVNGEVPLGWLPPLSRDTARDYWLSLRAELQAGSRLLLAAYAGGGIVGSGQLSFRPGPTPSTGPSCRKCSCRPRCDGRASAGHSLLDCTTPRGTGADPCSS